VLDKKLAGIARQLGCPVSDSKDVRSQRVRKVAWLARLDKCCVTRSIT
jgi:hypothetical protein